MTDQVMDAEGGSEVPQGLDGLELGALDALVAQARERGLQLTGEGGLLQELTRRVLEGALEGELTDHLGAGKHERAEDGPRENHRNGHRAKTVTTEVGPVEIRVPRDRAGTFEPQLVKKRQRRLGGVDEMVLSLSAKGLTHGEISAHLAEVYGATVSKQTISTITDSVIAGMVEWQNRPLDSVYPVVFIDCVHVKIRDGQVANRPIYMAIAVTCEGTRDILGLWAGDGGEGAKHWMQVLTEIKNRGVRDVLMLVCDGLTGLPDAVNAVWPDTIVQTCVVHRSRQETTWWSRTVCAAVEARSSAAVVYRCPAGAMAGPWASRTGRTSWIAFHRVLRETSKSSARVSRVQTRRR
jgi:transposase-like protein